ncbi:hypothetical protein ACHAWX_003618 [Stephanocyclus meneghinianus]
MPANKMSSSQMLFLFLTLAASPRPVAAFCAGSTVHTFPVALQVSSSSSTRVRTKNNDQFMHSDSVQLEASKNAGTNDDDDSHKSWNEAYAEAWRMRTRFGHHAAVPYYKQILSSRENSLGDTSASTRIAASEMSLRMLDLVGRSYSSRKSTGRETNNVDVDCADVAWEKDIGKLRNLLEKSHYNHSTIRQSVFNLPVGCMARQQHLNYHSASLEMYKNNYPMGPIYARPLEPGQYLDIQSIISDTPTSSSEGTYKSSLQCLTVLFLLASCIPKELFLRSVFDGEETLDLLLRLGLVFLCNHSSSEDTDNATEEWITPLVHLFPLEIPELIKPLEPNDNVVRNDKTMINNEERRKSLILMTDMHPKVLGLTSIPNNSQSNGDSCAGEEDGTVMYIGPDSLALVHHFHSIFLQFWNSRQLYSKSNSNGSRGKRRSSGSSSDHETSFAMRAPFKILDLCAGSGIQALAVLSMFQMLPSSDCNPDGEGGNALSVAVDINKRALRFTEFNSILNGFGVVDFETGRDTFNGNHSRIKICTVHADLIADKVLNRDSAAREKVGIELYDESLVDQLLFMFRRKKSYHETIREGSRFDVLLANPPFIPIPPKVSDNRVLSVFGNQGAHDNTPHYGLFSSGGEDGEECLRAIIQMTPILLSPGAMAIIVSEFMNPPLAQSAELDQALCSKIEKWWNYALDSHSVSPLEAKAILFTNEYAISSATYAQRRALRNDQDAVLLWEDHLEEKGINSVSPGLLFFRILSNRIVSQTRSRSKLEYHSNPSQRETMLMHRFVPKTKNGSIWTPHNFNAVESTRIDLMELFASHVI